MPGSKKDANKPSGRVSSYAYFIKTCRQEAARDRPGQLVSFKDFSVECSQRWKAMSEQEKAPFQQLSAQDKVRYDREMKGYVPPPSSPANAKGKGGKQGKGKVAGKKTPKDPNAPKGPLSAYFWFTNDERPKVKLQHPEYKIGDVAKAIGQLWGKVDPATKRRYEEKAQQDKARYERELAAYKSRQHVKTIVKEVELVEEEEEDEPEDMAGVEEDEDEDSGDEDGSDEEEEEEEDSDESD